LEKTVLQKLRIGTSADCERAQKMERGEEQEALKKLTKDETGNLAIEK
jgi:hypothetical protein